MATIFTHALLPVALKASGRLDGISSRLLVTAMTATIIPDADVLAFNFGISYSDEFGHRGFTHSIAFAVFIGLLGALVAGHLKASRAKAFFVLSLSVLSHPLLDAFTNGGLGVAFLWPLTDARYFMPWQPIEVSPIGCEAFFVGAWFYCDRF